MLNVGEVLPTVSYVPDYRNMNVKNAIALAYSNDLGIGLEVDTEVGGEDCSLEVKRSTTDAGNEDDGHLQLGVIPNED